MLRIDDRMYVKVEFDGKELPLQHCNLSYIQLNSHEKMGLPCGEILLGDSNMYFKKYIKLQQGMPVAVFVGQSPENLKKYDFSLFSFKEREQFGTVTYKLTLLLNKTKYLKEAAIKTFTGSSNDALKDIADKCGLTYKGITTQDRQTWVPANKVYFKWAVDISKKGYIDDKSCMMVGVTFDGELRYANTSNITKEIANNAKILCMGTVGDNKKSFTVWGKKLIDRSGKANALGATKMTTYEQNTHKDSGKQDKVKLTRKAKNTSLNKHNTNISRGRIDVSPIDPGNGHSKSADAIHQNKRLKLLQTQKLQLVLLSVVPIDMFDVVYVSVIDVYNAEGKPKINLEQSGYYVITGKTIFISPSGQYVEKYDMIREGSNASSNNGA